MNTDANIYSQLLLYSFLSGIFLRVSYDLLHTAGIIFLNIIAIIKHNKTEFAICNPYKDNNKPTSPILLKNSSTLKTLIPHLLPKKERLFSTAVIDVLFAIITAVTTVLLLFGLNLGEFRWFVFPIMAGGYALYSVTLSSPITRLILAVSLKVISLLSPLKRLIHLITVTPVKKIVTLIKHRTRKTHKKQPSTLRQTAKLYRETRENKKNQKN